MHATRRRLSRASLALAVTGMLVLTTACSSEPSEEPSGNQTLTIALSADPSGLDPQLVQDGNALAIYANISEPLVFRENSGELSPGLALEWENVDELTWRFTLRPDVTFSNGEEFNAEAVAYSVKRMIDPDFATQQSGWLGQISDAKAVDELTVDIVTAVPDPQVPSRMSVIMMVPPEASQDDSFGSKPIGTGPYVLDNWTRGGEATLSANADYWGEAPAIQNVVYRPIADATVRLSSLQRGELNLVAGLLPEQVDQAPATVKTRGIEFTHGILNMRSGPFSDVRVRQAANYAVDKQALLDGIYGGHGSIAQCQIIGDDVFGSNPNLKAYEYDPDKARQLLADAGETAPKVTFIGDATNRWLKDVELVQSVAGYLNAVGFEVDVQLLDFGAFLDEILQPGNTATTPREDIYFLGHSNDTGDADLTFTAIYSSTGIDASSNNSRLDQLTEQARSELDPQLREQMYQEAGQIGCDEAFHIFLLNLDNVYGLSVDLDWAPRTDGQILVKTMSWK